MLWYELLFSFQGRINRQDFLVVFVATIVVGCALAGLVTGVVWLLTLTRGPQAIPSFGASYILAGLIVFGPTILVGLSLGAKRLHDRGKSGWWLLLYWIIGGVLIAFGYCWLYDGIAYFLLAIGSLLVALSLVDLGFGPGTVGPNAYGLDPNTPGS
jgi:uncharacterized membrane protein YhaH (DUF805 family)